MTMFQLMGLGLLALVAIFAVDMLASYIVSRWANVTEAQADERISKANDALNERREHRK